MKTDGTEVLYGLRLYFIDNIRIVLTIFVVLHHLALTYGARSGWYFYESTTDGTTNLMLTTFLAVNRAFLMGFFFMISGYFTPGSFDRKGAGRFIQDRLLRLGVPLVFYSCLVRPVIVYTLKWNTLTPQDSFWANIFELRNVAPGPLWFVEVLLIFSGLYVLWRVAGPEVVEPKKETTGKAPGTAAIICFALLLGLVTFGLRVYFPPSFQIFHLRIGNYPQYVCLYIVGMIAYRRGWMSGLTGSVGRFWVPATVATLIAFVVMVGVSHRTGTLTLLTGGLHWQSLLGTLMENLLCVGMMISLLFVFSRKWNFQGGLTKAMAGDAYAVYILHSPIVVALAFYAYPVLRGYPLLKFCAVSATGVVLSFVISHYVRRLSFAERIL